MHQTFNSLLGAFLSAVIAIAAAFTQSVRAATQLWFDCDATSGLTTGTVVRDAGITNGWSTSAIPGTTAPGLWTNGDDAIFACGTGTPTANIAASGVTVNSLWQTANTQSSVIGGIVNVKQDGFPRLSQIPVFSAQNLPSVLHTIRIANTSGDYVAVDAFVVITGPAADMSEQTK